MARVDEAFSICERRYASRFIGFLDERQAALVKTHLSTRCNSRFFGGHEEAERVMLGVFSEDREPQDEVFPIVPVAFRFGKGAQLSHRDVLGSLLGCGIAREKVGDILCADTFAVAFLQEELAAFVVDHVRKIGNVGVKTECPYEGDLPTFHTFEPITGTVASARLDAVLKVLLKVSREQACDRIRDALVQVDHQPVLSVSLPVRAGQILSVRGSGRYIIDDVSDVTKKGRLVIKARKYV